jgi:hypothetical protein
VPGSYTPGEQAPVPPPARPAPASDLGTPPAAQFAAPQYEQSPYEPPQPVGAPVPPTAPGYGPPQPPQPPYGAPGQQGYSPYAGSGYGPRWNVSAIVSIISTGVGVFLVPFVGQIVGIIFGFVGLNQIKRTGEKGRGLALTGIWVGIGTLALFVLFVIIVVVIAVAASQSGTSYRY